MASSGNFCTYNPLPYSTSFRSNLGKGNLFSNPGNNCMGFGTMALTSGKKWYMEGIAQNAYNTTMGIFEINDANSIQNSLNTFYYNNTSYKSAFYHRDGTKYVDGSNSSYGATFAIGDVIGMAVDLESGTNTITFYKNNASQGSFNLGTNGLDYLFCMARGTSGGGWFMNFGQDSTFGGNKTAGGNADDSGFGDFFYAVPSGHLAVCSANLGISSDIDPAQTDTDYPSKQFNCIAYTGTGSSNAVTGLGFQPDLVVIKNRSGTQGTKWTDSSRGVTKVLQSAVANAESTDSNGLTAFGSDGFTVGSDAGYNGSSNGMVAWCWKANGGTTATNTEGATNSTVQANTKAGFSIIQYVGTGSTTTIGHGLDTAPDFMIHKNRDTTDNWVVYARSQGASKRAQLNSNITWGTSTGSFNSTDPSSTLITLGSSSGTNASSGNYVCYAWHNVEGYQRFGTYIGNNTDNDGPFVYTGFRPRMLAIKGATESYPWCVFDSARNTHNLVDKHIAWNYADAEATEPTGARKVDFLSNGFKVMADAASINGDADTYVYMAWGDVPFKYNNTF